MWSIVRIDVVCIFPGVMLFQKVLQADLKLEVISEPVCIYVLFHDPIVFIINLDRWQQQVLAVRNHVRLSLREDVYMENIVDFPVGR